MLFLDGWELVEEGGYEIYSLGQIPGHGRWPVRIEGIPWEGRKRRGCALRANIVGPDLFGCALAGVGVGIRIRGGRRGFIIRGL